VGVDSVREVQLGRKICQECGSTYRGTFYREFEKADKINCTTFGEMESFGAYFVSPSLGFDINYLKQTRLRLLVSRNAPGQEATVLQMYHELTKTPGLSDHTSLRDNLFHAIEGVAIAMRTPSKVVPFNVDFPAKLEYGTTSTYVCKSKMHVKELCFDGHFGLHRALDIGETRTRTPSGRPRKPLHDLERSAKCAQKDKYRCTLPRRTGGWQFVVDAKTGNVVGAGEHINNECNEDKHAVLMKVMKQGKVNVNLLCHDDMCHFEAWAKKRHAEAYKKVRYWVIDHFHRKNHKCSKKVLKNAEKRRLKGLNTSACEQFNSFARRFNFIFNSMRSASHRFWVTEIVEFWNANKNIRSWRNLTRRNVLSRAMKASEQSRPDDWDDVIQVPRRSN